MQTNAITNLTIAELAIMLGNKEISSLEITEAFLTKISQLDKKINSFITVTNEAAIEAAKDADKARSSSSVCNPLLGIPIAHKDLFSTKGVLTTCASKMLHNYIPPYDATCVTKLKQSGMVMLGKLNMDEFAMGSSNENSFFGNCNNPWNLKYVTGGSSGGSAAAVAQCLAPATTGTDTGGSIRLPAAFCGVSGIKPTYGRVSRWGMAAFASSLDQAGIFAKTAYDCAILLEAIAGHDILDSTSLNQPVPQYSKLITKPINKLTIGLPEEFFNSKLDNEVAKILDDALLIFKNLGVNVKSISLPNNHLCIPTYYILAPAEASSNLSRYDGIRYGHRSKNYTNIEELIKNSREEGFGAEVKRRILTGTYVLSSGYYDAFYLKAQQTRQIIKNDFNKAFQEVDAIFAPTAPKTAFKQGEMSQDPVQMYLSDIYTVAVNLANLPAMSIPAGFIDSLPVGLQLIGKHLDENTILQLAHQFQQQTDHHLQKPNNIKES